MLRILVGALAIPERDDSRHNLHGYLYFGGGSFLGQFDLSDGSGAVVVNLSDVNIRHVSDFGGRDLLLTVSGPVNNQVVSRMLRYDVDTGQQRTMFAGRKARFVSGDGHLLFHLERRLLYSSAGANAYSETEIDRRSTGDTPVVVLGNDKILFGRRVDGGELIMLYDLYTGEEQPLESLSQVCRLPGAVWLADRDQLFCPARDETGFVIASLDLSTIALTRPESLSTATPLVYLPGQSAIVLQRPGRTMFGGRRNEVWVYDLEERRAFRLSADQYLGESVAYKRY